MHHASLRLGVLALLGVFLLPPVRGDAPEVGENPDGEPAVGDREVDDRTPESLLAAGDYDGSIEGFKARVDKDAKDEAALRGWAEALEATGRYAEALQILSGATSQKSSASLSSMAGRVHLRRGDLAAAETAFRAAVEITSDASTPPAKSLRFEALNRLGEVLERTGRKDEARERWNELIALYEGLDADEARKLGAAGFVEAALACVGLNRYRDANDVLFPQAQELDEHSPALLVEWARTLFDKYNFPDSRALLVEATTNNPRFADARVLRAENYLIDFQVGTQRYQLAEAELARALEVNPSHAGAFAARGRLWLSDGNLPRAVGDFRKALEIDPANTKARGLLAAALFLDVDETGFAAEEKKALALNPKAAGFYHTIAEAIEMRFRYADAARFSEKALEIDPGYWRAFHTMGINLLRMGDYTRGREYLDKSFKEDPFNVWVHNTRLLLKHMDKSHVSFTSGSFRYKVPKDDRDVLELFLAPLLDDAKTKLEAHYRVNLSPPVFIEAFSEHQWFSARIVGLGGFPASGACFGNLVALTTPKALPQNWGAVAWHEFAHVVTLHATGHRVPRWLTEGLSVFEEGRDHPRWARQFEREIADAYASGHLLPLAELDFGFSKPKWAGQVLMSYYQGCMIVKFISERWAFDKVLEMLDGYRRNRRTPDIIRDVFGIGIEEFDRGFFTYLADWIAKNGYEPALGEEMVAKLAAEREGKPDDPKLLSELAWAYFCTGNDVDSPICASKAIAIDPEHGDAHAVLGFNRLAEKKYKSAAESLALALAKGSRFRFRAHEALGRIALKDGDKEKAIESFEAARKASPRAGAGQPRRGNVYYALADLYKAVGRESLAIERLEELRSFAVEDGHCREQLATHYLRGEDDESAKKALEVLEELVFINPFDRKLHERIARAAVKLAKHEIVIRQYTLLLKYPDSNPVTVYLELARASLALDRKDDAQRWARKLLEVDAENADGQAILDKASAGAEKSR